MAEDEVAPEKKDGTERRVYNLPANLLLRLRAYQLRQGIASEAEAARRLIDAALQMRDTIDDILQTIKKRYEDERDLRVLASDILAKHALVTGIHFSDGGMWFRLENGDRGMLTHKGKLMHGDSSQSDDYWNNWDEPQPPKRGASFTPSWEPAGDLEDEIPF